MAEKEKPQEQPGEQTDKLLAKVPEESIFRCHDGRAFRDMEELAEGLVAMSDDTFAYHVNSERNDFSKWVKGVIGDEKLAGDLATATNRTQATGYVTDRLAALTGKGKMSKPIGKKQGQPQAKDKIAQPAEQQLKDLPLAEILKQLSSSPDGLSSAEAQKRIDKYGYNELPEKKENPLLKFLSYFWGPIPIMIIVAAALSGVLRHWPDLGVILALLVLNAIVGFRE
jgi:magnesium-transporting ATPase (P-type)